MVTQGPEHGTDAARVFDVGGHLKMEIRCLDNPGSMEGRTASRPREWFSEHLRGTVRSGGRRCRVRCAQCRHLHSLLTLEEQRTHGRRCGLIPGNTDPPAKAGRWCRCVYLTSASQALRRALNSQGLIYMQLQRSLSKVIPSSPSGS